MKISTKKIWISSSAWRGRETYQSASGGANDTGTWSDSPCPSNQREAEIKMFTDALKKEAMQYVETYKEDGGMLRMCSMVAAMGEVMQPDNSSEWKKRFLSMCPGIEFPADFDQLSEEEKQRRLDGAIKAGLDENK